MIRYPEPKVLLPDAPGELDRRHRSRRPQRPDYSGKHIDAGLAIQVKPPIDATARILARVGTTREAVAAQIWRDRK